MEFLVAPGQGLEAVGAAGLLFWVRPARRQSEKIQRDSEGEGIYLAHGQYLYLYCVHLLGPNQRSDRELKGFFEQCY